MKATEIRKDSAWLLATAKLVAKELKIQCEGTPLRIRIPKSTAETNTGGWAVSIGDIGKEKPSLEIWLDRFSGYPDRKLWACFHSETRGPIKSIVKRVSRKLWAVREVHQKDVVSAKYNFLKTRLNRYEFNAPILELYNDGDTYFGIYDLTRPTSERINRHFVERAVCFYNDVIHSLSGVKDEDKQREIYSKVENRKLVESHLKRERNRLLANDRKEIDKYKCQVCGFHFGKRYGKLGDNFAEAHHLVPLSKLDGEQNTRIEDLATVCANCHRMLHRMTGKRNDIVKLKNIIKAQRQKS